MNLLTFYESDVSPEIKTFLDLLESMCIKIVPLKRINELVLEYKRRRCDGFLWLTSNTNKRSVEDKMIQLGVFKTLSTHAVRCAVFYGDTIAVCNSADLCIVDQTPDYWIQFFVELFFTDKDMKQCIEPQEKFSIGVYNMPGAEKTKMIYYKGDESMKNECSWGIYRTMKILTDMESTVIEVGSNTGRHSIRIAPYVKEIHSIEPHPQLVDLQYASVKLNKFENMHVYQLGLSSLKGHTYVNPLPICGDYKKITLTSEKTKHIVDIISGDEFIEHSGLTSVNLIKIDTNGSDYNVLVGLKTTLETQSPYVLMPLFDAEQMFGYTPLDVIKFMENRYVPYLIVEKSLSTVLFVPVSEEFFKERFQEYISPIKDAPDAEKYSAVGIKFTFNPT